MEKTVLDNDEVNVPNVPTYLEKKGKNNYLLKTDVAVTELSRFLESCNATGKIDFSRDGRSETFFVLSKAVAGKKGGLLCKRLLLLFLFVLFMALWTYLVVSVTINAMKQNQTGFAFFDAFVSVPEGAPA